MGRNVKKRILGHVRPAKDQISRRILDGSFRGPHEDTLHPLLSKLGPVRITIRLC